ncbi:MAG: NifU family protein [Alphaproteobacteria bacterium]|nr:NifU family protein [Alphaproteobacteria bacterium]
MFIQTQATPNPATVKFLPGRDVLAHGTAEFKSPESAARSPLAQRLFALQGVTGVFFGGDFVSVSKAGDTDWSMLKPMVLAALMEHFSLDRPVMLDTPTPTTPENSDNGPDSPLIAQIRELIETRVRPAVMMDGGDIVFESFEDGIVYLRMQGACSGCPSSTMTLKSGIENMLKHYVPEVLEVRAAPSS